MPNQYELRVKRLQRQLASTDHEALLISSPINVRYLTGFTGDSSWLLVERKKILLISDGRFTVQLEDECPNLPVVYREVGQIIEHKLAEVLQGKEIKNLGVEGAHFRIGSLETIRSTDGCTTEIHSTMGLVESLRNIKDKHEIQEMRKAVDIAERAFQSLIPMLQPDWTEIQVRNRLEYLIRELGAEEAAFETIVAAGPRAALPHAHPSEVRIGDHPLLLIDWGAKLSSGYHSDMTRVLFFGKPSAKMRKAYEAVRETELASIEALAAGVPCVDIDKTCRKVLKKRKLEEAFNHGLGHGLGMEVHEAIRLSPTSEQTLEAGMVITIEPGVYFADWGGIRIEDDVLITANGYEVLSSLPTDLDAMTINW